jgi:hypothetical protein
LRRIIEATPGRPSIPATAIVHVLTASPTPVIEDVRLTIARAPKPKAAAPIILLKTPGLRRSAIITPTPSAATAITVYVSIIFLLDFSQLQKQHNKFLTTAFPIKIAVA